MEISIHALREEGDRSTCCPSDTAQNFYPRPPRGGRQKLHIRRNTNLLYFYPRPPRGGRRWATWRTARCKSYFYPRPPRGGRLQHVLPVPQAPVFLSTPSARRATRKPRVFRLKVRVFLSTPSARRATWTLIPQKLMPPTHFYPRPPRGGRPVS